MPPRPRACFKSPHRSTLWGEVRLVRLLSVPPASEAAGSESGFLAAFGCLWLVCQHLGPIAAILCGEKQPSDTDVAACRGNLPKPASQARRQAPKPF